MHIAQDVKDPRVSENDMELAWPPQLDPTPNPGGHTPVAKLSFYGHLPPDVRPGNEFCKYWTVVYRELRLALCTAHLVQLETLDNIYPFMDDREKLGHLTFSPRDCDMLGDLNR